MITTRKELEDYLRTECDFTDKDFEIRDDRDLLDAYLRYNGVVCFTDTIIALCSFLNFDDE